MTGLSLEGFNHLRSSRTTENRFNRVESPNPLKLPLGKAEPVPYCHQAYPKEHQHVYCYPK